MLTWFFWWIPSCEQIKNIQNILNIIIFNNYGAKVYKNMLAIVYEICLFEVSVHS